MSYIKPTLWIKFCLCSSTPYKPFTTVPCNPVSTERYLNQPTCDTPHVSWDPGTTRYQTYPFIISEITKRAPLTQIIE